MTIVELIGNAMIVTGAAVLTIGLIGLALTRIDEYEEDTHERENQQTGA